MGTFCLKIAIRDFVDSRTSRKETSLANIVVTKIFVDVALLLKTTLFPLWSDRRRLLCNADFLRWIMKHFYEKEYNTITLIKFLSLPKTSKGGE